ncbi:hypothetical protein J437_LFUL001276 [Ladona fulva]|uniref:Mutator-like transposase domain-containing protein n=1 Tax=Ladona fulva TaxID=123851 RepID=A0A8K0NWE6_LADFU|nr:hypothetical protein J437_LFUL001276 [Ladona fulva]
MPAIIISSCPYVGSTYEVNQRFIFAMRLLGIGLVGKTRFCGIMDLHGPIFQTNYDLIMNNLESASDAVCKLILRRSVEEEKEKTMEANSSKGLTLSGDGTWRKRGFNSFQCVDRHW